MKGPIKKNRGRKQGKPTSAHSCVGDNASKVSLLNFENSLNFL